MDRNQLRLRRLYLLPLIVSLQVSSSLAFPFAANKQRTNEVPDHDCPPEERPRPPHWRSVSGIDYETTLSSTSYKSDSWNPTAYQISDGQVQAVYTVLTEEFPVTSSGTIVLSTSTVTSYHSYTPVPRQVTSVSTSTSTTTVYVSASPSPAPAETTSAGSPPSVATPATTSTGEGSPATTANPQQSLTTSIPDSSLTSLTTSEVQTVTAPPVTNTSGVSISLPLSECSLPCCGSDSCQIASMAQTKGTRDCGRRFSRTALSVGPSGLSGHEYFACDHAVTQEWTAPLTSIFCRR